MVLGPVCQPESARKLVRPGVRGQVSHFLHRQDLTPVWMNRCSQWWSGKGSLPRRCTRHFSAKHHMGSATGWWTCCWERCVARRPSRNGLERCRGRKNEGAGGGGEEAGVDERAAPWVCAEGRHLSHFSLSLVDCCCVALGCRPAFFVRGSAFHGLVCHGRLGLLPSVRAVCAILSRLGCYSRLLCFYLVDAT